MTDDSRHCCPVSRESAGEEASAGDAGRDESRSSATRTTRVDPSPSGVDRNSDVGEMVKVDGGTFIMGTDEDGGFPEDGEGPTREVTVDPFFVDTTAVTNAEFFQFVHETGYTTDAEQFGWSFVFHDLISDEDERNVLRTAPDTPWWLVVDGANWVRPFGPDSNVLAEKTLLDHPVTHVSWQDARAYADWAGKRLPTEAEWEYAARGGLEQARFPWGDELTPDGEHRCNIWQGDFPDENTGEDGYHWTAPVDEYRPNGYGLYNVSGNVWEWCADWFSAEYHTTAAYDPDNPTGPDEGRERVMRGGSHLCHRSWCNRYRVGARSKNTPDSSTSNLGFRCVRDI